MSINHESPMEGLPPLSQKQLNTQTWGAGGNTCTIVDGKIKVNSQILVQVTGSVPQAGHWALAVTNAQLVITSSDSESSTLPISYCVY